jgi:hypothetical protein
MGRIKNGDVLTLAEKQFEVFVTVDRNLSFQQNLTLYNIAVIVLRGRSNRFARLASSGAGADCVVVVRKTRRCSLDRSLMQRS